MTIVLRQTKTSDYDGILACLQRNGMSGWSRARWLSIWDDYPYRADFDGIPRGFVLEVDGTIVGSISNIWAKYFLAGRELRVTVAGNAAVDTAHRAGSIRLFGEQILQPGVDLYINGSASEAASKIMTTLKVPRVPQPDNDLFFLWAARGPQVARAGLKRRKVPLAGVLAWPVGAGMQLGSRFKLLGAPRTRYDVRPAASFTEEFDELWQGIRGRTTRLVSFRDRATLHWRYSHAISVGDAALLVARRGGLLVGYAVLMRTRRPALGLVAYAIHDLQCVDEDPGIVQSLLAGAWRQTRDASLDLLEWSGFVGTKHAVAERMSFMKYRLDVWQAFYHTRDAGLKKELTSPDRWEFSPYDSD